jgi:O-succinylbenzoic acid--CoA ligase
VQVRQLETGSLASGLADALAGRGPVAPACEPRLAAALALAEPVTETGAAVVVPTSGTTSEPRAVVLTADAVTFSANATHQRLGGAGDWVCALPTQHIAGLMTVARAVVAGTSVRFARGDLADLPEADGRTYLSLVAAQLDRALAEPRLVGLLGDYAAVLLGGSAIPSGLVGRAKAAGIAVVTTYGASETCGGCVYDGRPLDGVRVELDGDRISLGGPMAFAGYRLRPELTASVLTGDLVRTSDRGRFVEGRLEVLGRLDDVVISGGEKVDLAAVQHACDAAFGSPAAGGVAVLAVPDERWGSRVVGLTSAPLVLAEVQARLEPVVGRAAVPKELRQVAAMAYTSLGKIDRVALRRAWDGER